MEYFLIKFKCNWADEFDVEGFYAVDKETKETMMDSLADAINREVYFGTNQYLEFTSERHLLRALTVTELTLAEYGVLQQVFPHGHGFLEVLDLLRYLPPCAECGDYDCDCEAADDE